jgi:uncharacterized protein (DUF1800 family)
LPGETLTRRTLFRTAGVGAVAAALPVALPGTGLASLVSDDWPRLQWPAAAPATTADLPAPDPIVHLVNRITFGLRPSDLDRARSLGFTGFVEEQLHPESIDDAETEAAVAAAFPTLTMSTASLLKIEKGAVSRELKGAAVHRAVASRRQLFEMMVDFWSNHFSIYQNEGQIYYLKTVDDRDVARRFAFGKFRDLLGASASSPAMLLFLNNAENKKNGPNENYGREVMELHTIGVDGGYTQQDVQEVAKAFTGWTVGKRGPQQGRFVFAAADHDNGARTVLGQSIPAGLGQGHGERVLDILAAHPATARRIATKLCVRFVSDTPPASLVNAAATTFTSSGGDIRETMRTILLAAEFRAAADQKFRRPFEHVTAAVRTLDAVVTAEGIKPLLGVLRLLGQLPFDWHAPNGYPDANGAWANTNGILNGWNLGLSLGGNHLAGVQTDLTALSAGLKNPTALSLTDALAQRLLARRLVAADRDRIVQYVAAGRPPGAPIPAAKVKASTTGAIALLLDSPYFQWR